MTQLEINGVQFPFDSSFSAWSNLLDDLETHRISKGNAIASVFFDGEEISQFRHGDILEHSLNAVNTIQITTSSIQGMVKEAIADAGHYQSALQNAVLETAEMFRLQNLKDANSQLSEIFQGIKMFIALVKGLEIQGSVHAPMISGQVDKLVEEMGPTLESLIESQNQQDWILVADILEFELASAINAFEPVIQDLARPSNQE
jgi:hypothetical protein